MRAERTDPTASTPFAARMSVEQVEEGLALAPKFDADGLIPCITTDASVAIWYSSRDDLNLLSLRFEDMKADLPAAIDEITRFLDWRRRPMDARVRPAVTQTSIPSIWSSSF